MATKPRKAATRPQVVTKSRAGRPSDHQEPTAVKEWKKAATVLTLPSGNSIRVKNPGITELAHLGIIPNNLMAVIMDSVQKGAEPDADQLMENVEVTDMLDMMSNAICVIAVEPEIHPVPVWTEEDQAQELCKLEQVGKPAEQKKDLETLYIDEVDEEDKMFLWQWATGGTDDVEQFRQESGNMLASLSGQPAVAVPAKRAAARKR